MSRRNSFTNQILWFVCSNFHHNMMDFFSLFFLKYEAMICFVIGNDREKESHVFPLNVSLSWNVLYNYFMFFGKIEKNIKLRNGNKHGIWQYLFGETIDSIMLHGFFPIGKIFMFVEHMGKVMTHSHIRSFRDSRKNYTFSFSSFTPAP